MTATRQRSVRPRRGRARPDPDARRRELLAAETGTIVRDAPYRIALAYPNPYRVAMSSLGYQVVYRMLNARPAAAAERVVLPDDVAELRRTGRPPVSLETGRPLGSFDLVAFSVTYDLDLTGLFELLDLARIPVRRDERDDRHPPVLVGGPITTSNVLPLGPFADLVVVGDGEQAIEGLLDALEAARDRADLIERAARVRGVWAPALHGDRVPATEKVTTGLPAYGQVVTPHAELASMFLVEASRGCPRYCKFCLVRAPESPMREAPVDAVLERVPASAPRVGFVGAAISEWDGIRDALARVVERGQGVGISSLRADRLDRDFVGLLARGGYRTLTVASDAPSQRQRDRMAKALRARHLVEAARLARAAGMTRLKMYVIVGLPGETDEDLDELVELSRELAAELPLALGLSPLVPKLHTPLGDAPFAGIPALERTLARVARGLRGVADLRPVSARWSWVEYRMSQGAQDAGLAALEAWRRGGRFGDWKGALGGARERGALEAARAHALWPAAGMR